MIPVQNACMTGYIQLGQSNQRIFVGAVIKCCGTACERIRVLSAACEFRVCVGAIKPGIRNLCGKIRFVGQAVRNGRCALAACGK